MSMSTTTAWGRTLAVLTIGAASIALAGCSLIGNVTANDPATDPSEGVETDAFAIEVGDCLNDGNLEGEISTVPTIDCAEPHDSEAYASIIIDDGPYPGEDAIFEQADADCVAEFNTFVGVNYDESVLNFSYYFPTEGSWENGDREILCLIYEDGTKTVGSLAGAAR